MTSMDEQGLYWDPEARDGKGGRISTHSAGRKSCSTCKKNLALSNFTPRRTSADGYRDQCKKCRREISNKSRQARVNTIQAEGKMCKGCGNVKLYKRVSGRFALFCDYCRKLRQRCRRVGITTQEYYEMVEKQQGVCLLCEVRPLEVIDHNYLTGKVRGLLCNGCNLLAGWAAQQGNIAVSKLGVYLDRA